MTQDEKENAEKKKVRAGISRGEFIAGTVGGVVVGAVAGAAAGSFGFPRTVTQIVTQTSTQVSTQTTTQATTQTVTTTALQPWLPGSWDHTTDVVVVGSGGAGLAAAVGALESGAKVIVVEKASAVGAANRL